MQNMWTDNSSTAYSSAEAVKQERIFMIYCCYISKGYKVNNVITFSCPCLWAATNCIWQWPSLPPSLDWETLSWQSPHFQRLKTLFQILNLPLALETFTFKGRSLSAILNFLLKVRQIATDDLHFIINDDNDDDYVKYTLQLSWFTLPKTRPEPDPEPGLLTITRPEPDPKSKSATRQALVFCHSVKMSDVLRSVMIKSSQKHFVSGLFQFSRILT